MSNPSIFDLSDMFIRSTIVAVVHQVGGCVMRIDIQAIDFDLTDGLREPMSKQFRKGESRS